jgi:hypothetical protein
MGMGLPFLLMASVVLPYHCANRCAKDKSTTARLHRYSKMLQLGTTIVLLVCVKKLLVWLLLLRHTFASHSHPVLFFFPLLKCFHANYQFETGTLPCVKKSSPCCGAKPSKAWTTVRGTVVVVHVNTASSTALGRVVLTTNIFFFVFVSFKKFVECHTTFLVR